jgi:hypothetical protein
VSKACVDESIDEAGGEVLPGRVDGPAAIGRPHVVQVRLVDILRGLRLHDVQLAGQVQEVVVQLRVRHDLVQVVKVVRLLGNGCGEAKQK